MVCGWPWVKDSDRACNIESKVSHTYLSLTKSLSNQHYFHRCLVHKKWLGWAGVGQWWAEVDFLHSENALYLQQCVTVPKILNDTDTDTFSGTKYFRYRYRYFFPIPNFTDTGSDTFFRYQIFPIPVPIPPEKMKNSRFRYRYPL